MKLLARPGKKCFQDRTGLHISLTLSGLWGAFLVTAALQSSAESPLPPTSVGSNDKKASVADLDNSLKGGVQYSVVQAEAELKNIRSSSKRLGKLSLLFMGELQRPDMVTVAAPNVVGTTVVPAMPNVTGEVAIGHLPPRQSMLVAILYEISRLVSQIHEAQQALKVPLSEKLQVIDDWYAVTEIKRDIVQHYNNLQIMLERTNPNQALLSQEIIKIYDDAKKIQAPLNRVLIACDKERKSKGRHS